MDLEIIILSQVRQSKTNAACSTYTWNLKNDTNELIYKTDSQTQGTGLWLPKGKEWGRDKLGVCEQQIQTTIYKIDNTVLLQSTWNYIEDLVITYNGKESEKEHIYVYVCKLITLPYTRNQHTSHLKLWCFHEIWNEAVCSCHLNSQLLTV